MTQVTQATILSPEVFAVFETVPDLYLIIAADFTIITASDNYIKATHREREDIQGKFVFDIFPDNPNLPGSNGTENLRSSLEWVLEHKQPHHMALQRYDVARPSQPMHYEEKYWLPINTPVLDKNGNVLYIIHKVTDATEQVKTEKELNSIITQTEQQVRTTQDSEQKAQGEVKDRRALLQAFLDQAPVAMSLYQGNDHKILQANPFMCRIWGRTQEQVIGKPLLEALPELEGQGFDRRIQEVLTMGVPYVGKEAPATMLRNGHLETNYYNFVYQPLYDDDGSILGIFNVAVEVTELVTARLKVEDSEQKLRVLNGELEARVAERTKELEIAKAEIEVERNRLHQLFMAAATPICILNGENFVYELVNEAYQQLLPGRHLLGNPMFDTALSELSEHSLALAVKQVYETGETYIGKEELIPVAQFEGGPVEERYFNYTLQPRQNDMGEIDGVFVFASEVTEQVEARKEVEQSAESLRLITDALPVLIGYLDNQEKYRFANHAYEAWFNTNPENLLGRHVKEVVGEKAYQGVKQYIDRALAGERLEFESRMPYRKDFVKHIHTNYIPDIREGQVQGFYTLVTDITEQVKAMTIVEESERQAKEMAEELRVANEQLTRTNIDLDNFIYTASHDLKAPIGNIEGLIEVMTQSLSPEILAAEGLDEVMVMIDNSIRRFKRTIDHLTEVVKLQKENNQDAVRVSLSEVIHEVRLDLEPQLEEAGAKLEVAVNECPEIRFTEKNLRSIVYNLISNAVKYRSPERKPEISLSCQTEEKYVILTVRDNGLGMNLKGKSKLFVMFSRLHDHVEGSGIGLYMVKRIIENAGGRIEVESEPGIGSVFKVYFKR